MAKEESSDDEDANSEPLLLKKDATLGRSLSTAISGTSPPRPESHYGSHTPHAPAHPGPSSPANGGASNGVHFGGASTSELQPLGASDTLRDEASESGLSLSDSQSAGSEAWRQKSGSGTHAKKGKLTSKLKKLFKR